MTTKTNTEGEHPLAKSKIQQLFLNWISIPETQDIIQEHLEMISDSSVQMEESETWNGQDLNSRNNNNKPLGTSSLTVDEVEFVQKRSPPSSPTHLSPISPFSPTQQQQLFTSPKHNNNKIPNANNNSAGNGTPPRSPTAFKNKTEQENIFDFARSEKAKKKLDFEQRQQHQHENQSMKNDESICNKNEYDTKVFDEDIDMSCDEKMPDIITTSSAIVKTTLPSSSLSTISSTNSYPTLGGGNQNIPRFYFPDGNPGTEQEVLQEMKLMNELFLSTIDGFNVKEFKRITCEVCKLPMFLNSTLFKRVDTKKKGKITLNQFEEFWRNELKSKSIEKRYFNILKKSENNFIEPIDFKLLMEEICRFHSSLEFLKSAAPFQQKYAETVIARIFYSVNRSGNCRITWQEFKSSKLVESLEFISKGDVNQEYNFFSYEHFYVLYCKFWELDTDHNFIINKQDFQTYGNYSLSSRIIDRIMSGCGRRLSTRQSGLMSYEDFIWFCLSEEDKTTPTAMEYWFRCVDLDGDGAIRPYELQYFCEEQMHRMGLLGVEVVPLENLFSQIFDMIKPKENMKITMRDIRKSPYMSSVFFNLLFNLHKYLTFEARGFAFSLLKKSNLQFPLSDWNRFARAEYDRMAQEEETDEEAASTANSFVDSMITE